MLSPDSQIYGNTLRTSSDEKAISNLMNLSRSVSITHPYEIAKKILDSHFTVNLPGVSTFSVPINPTTLLQGYISMTALTHDKDNKSSMPILRLNLVCNDYLKAHLKPTIRKKVNEFLKSDHVKKVKKQKVSEVLELLKPYYQEEYKNKKTGQTFQDFLEKKILSKGNPIQMYISGQNNTKSARSHLLNYWYKEWDLNQTISTLYITLTQSAYLNAYSKQTYGDYVPEAFRPRSTACYIERYGEKENPQYKESLHTGVLKHENVTSNEPKIDLYGPIPKEETSDDEDSDGDLF